MQGNLRIVRDTFPYQLLTLPGQDVNICTVLPYLGCLLAVPPPGDHIFPRLDVFRDDHLVGDHTKSPVPTAPAFMAVVVRRVEVGRHVGGVPTIPALIYFWAWGWEVGTICLVWTSSGGTLLFADFSRGAVLTPAATDKCHTYVIIMDPRNWVASPS